MGTVYTSFIQAKPKKQYSQLIGAFYAHLAEDGLSNLTVYWHMIKASKKKIDWKHHDQLVWLK